MSNNKLDDSATAASIEGFPPILVRMGMHTGEATERGEDYFDQRVPEVRIEHLTDAQVRDFPRSFAAGSQDRLVAIVAQTRLIPARLVP